MMTLVASVKSYERSYRYNLLKATCQNVAIRAYDRGHERRRYNGQIRRWAKISRQEGVMKASYYYYEECSRIALNVDSAIWRACRGPYGTYNTVESKGTTSVWIGNVNGGHSARDLPEQLRKYVRKGEYFRCHK